MSVRLRAGALLGLTVVLATVLHAVLALRSPSPWVMPDEIRYSELAKSLGAGGLPAIRGEVTFDFGLGYPALLAPVWALFDNVSTAYAVAKTLNAVLLGLTAVPAYFLARRFLDVERSLIVSLLSVSVPSLLYAGTLMTEVALYPTYVLALLAIAVALDRPTIATQLAAIGAITLASMVKLLAATLVIGYVGAVALYHWLDTREGRQWRRRLRSYWPTWSLLGGLVVLACGTTTAIGRSPLELLGAYDFVLPHADVLALPRWMFLHLAEFDLYVAIIPFAATALVIARGFGRHDRQVQLFTALAVAASIPLFAAVAGYSSTTGSSLYGYTTGAGANERATFVLAPLAFIGLLLWLRERHGSHRAVVAVAVGAALIPAAIPHNWLEKADRSVQAYALVPWWGSDFDAWPWGALVLGLVLGVLFVLLARAGARDSAFVLPVITVLVAVTLIAQGVQQADSERARAAGVGKSEGWVDAISRGAPVSVLWYEKPGRPAVPPLARHRVVWVNEFFNRSIGKIYEIGSPLPYAADLPSTHVRLRGGAIVLEDGTPARLGPLVLAPCHVHVEGRTIASDSTTGAVLYRVPATVRVRVTAPGRCPTLSR
jgi:hypothetical protein